MKRKTHPLTWVVLVLGVLAIIQFGKPHLDAEVKKDRAAELLERSHAPAASAASSPWWHKGGKQ